MGEAFPSLLQRLEGQLVKVECNQTAGGIFWADEVEWIANKKDIEIEGVISQLNSGQGSFVIDPYTVHIVEQTLFENNRRRPRSFEDLVNGMRVKVKVERREDRIVEAGLVRIYEESLDEDLEIVAVVDALEPDGSQLTLLGLDVHLTPKTRFPNIQMLREAEQLEGGRETGIRRDDDEPDLAPIRIGRVFVGGKIGLLHEGSRDFDLDRNSPDAPQLLIPSAQMELSMPLAESSEVYAKFGLSRRILLEEGSNGQERLRANLSEAFLYLGNFIHPALALQVGRQRMRDDREWLFDDQLDAVRLHFKADNLETQVAAARRVFRPSGSRSDQLYLIARTRYRLPGRRYLGGYLIKRNDLTPRDEDPIWFGLQTRGPITENLHYWGEASRMMGRRRDRLLRGHAFDVGGSYSIRLPLQPTLAAGYAFGSGDNDLSDGVDGNFRQTSLQDNSHRIGGLKRFRYYGVLSEPELFNIRIVTLQMGIRPAESWSLDLLYHNYLQAVPDDDIGDSELRNVEPTGRDPRLGREFNLIFAFRKKGQFDFFIFSGLYLPGPAYRTRNPAFLFRPELRFYF